MVMTVLFSLSNNQSAASYRSRRFLMAVLHVVSLLAYSLAMTAPCVAQLYFLIHSKSVHLVLLRVG